MADTKIASLTDGLTTSGTDRIPVAISPYGSGNNAYITPSYLKTFMVTGGTVTSSTPVFDMTQTWNSGAVTFSGLKLNITDTASAAASLLMDLQVGGSSKFTVQKDGAVSGTTFDLLSGFGGISDSGGPWVASSGKMAFGGNFAGPFLQYDGNNNRLGLRDGTNAQTLNVYNTWSSAGANYERLTAKWSSNIMFFGTEAGGTGTIRAMVIGANPTGGAGVGVVQIWGNTVLIGTGPSGANSWTFNASGHIIASTDNAYDIGASGANRPRNLYVAGTVTSSGVAIGTHVSLPSASFVSWGSRAALKSPADKVVSAVDTSGTGPAILNNGQFTVAALPSAATYPGSMAFVSDANATTARSTVAGGGSNKVMVMSDGTNWLIVA